MYSRSSSSVADLRRSSVSASIMKPLAISLSGTRGSCAPRCANNAFTTPGPRQLQHSFRSALLAQNPLQHSSWNKWLHRRRITISPRVKVCKQMLHSSSRPVYSVMSSSHRGLPLHVPFLWRTCSRRIFSCIPSCNPWIPCKKVRLLLPRTEGPGGKTGDPSWNC